MTKKFNKKDNGGAASSGGPTGTTTRPFPQPLCALGGGKAPSLVQVLPPWQVLQDAGGRLCYYNAATTFCTYDAPPPPLSPLSKTLRLVVFVLSLSFVCGLTSLFVYGHIIRKPFTSVAGCCEMLYMHPSYTEVDLRTPSPKRFGSYRLLRFDDRGRSSYPQPLGQCLRPPVLFVPGHWGSASQGRSLGAHGYLRRPSNLHPASYRERNAGSSDDRIEQLLADSSFPFSSSTGDPDPLHPLVKEYDVYIADFGGESTIFHSRQLTRQAAYVELAIQHIVTVACSGSPYSSVVLVGHSFGGLVSLYSVFASDYVQNSRESPNSVPAVSAVIALASPLRNSPITMDWSMAALYDELFVVGFDVPVPLLSISGSNRDELVSPFLTTTTHPNSLAMVSSPTTKSSSSASSDTAAPIVGEDGHPCGVDHRAMCWCSHVMSNVRDAIVFFSNASRRCSAKIKAGKFAPPPRKGLEEWTDCKWQSSGPNTNRERVMLKELLNVYGRNEKSAYGRHEKNINRHSLSTDELHRRILLDEQELASSMDKDFPIPIRTTSLFLTMPDSIEPMFLLWPFVGAMFMFWIQYFADDHRTGVSMSILASFLCVVAMSLYMENGGTYFFLRDIVSWATVTVAYLILLFGIFPALSRINGAVFSIFNRNKLYLYLTAYLPANLEHHDDIIVGFIGFGLFWYLNRRAPIGPSLSARDPLPQYFTPIGPSRIPGISASALHKYIAYNWVYANFATAWEFFKAACVPASPDDPSGFRRRFLATLLVPYFLLTTADYASCWDLLLGEYSTRDVPDLWTDLSYNLFMGTFIVFVVLKLFSDRTEERNGELRQGYIFCRDSLCPLAGVVLVSIVSILHIREWGTPQAFFARVPIALLCGILTWNEIYFSAAGNLMRRDLVEIGESKKQS